MLEHATIPIYMSALYSIKPNKNPEATGMLTGILIAEMMHLALACNVL